MRKLKTLTLFSPHTPTRNQEVSPQEFKVQGIGFDSLPADKNCLPKWLTPIKNKRRYLWQLLSIKKRDTGSQAYKQKRQDAQKFFTAAAYIQLSRKQKPAKAGGGIKGNKHKQKGKHVHAHSKARPLYSQGQQHAFSYCNEPAFFARQSRTAKCRNHKEGTQDNSGSAFG
ncbi:Hypothetical predicted protein [Podarcis lilfordi]|uniref:Uncharacterized protein n=1 Tax=Podarcis lilfordi TaxID=74358 RepID=A0AA35P4F1_9SAUR|nr:Hypothetical predicted protein [Podarcis lilfordi]